MRTGDRFVGGTTNWRTVLYADLTSGTLLTTAENIELFKALGVMMTPELKTRGGVYAVEGEKKLAPTLMQLTEQIGERLLSHAAGWTKSSSPQMGGLQSLTRGRPNSAAAS